MRGHNVPPLICVMAKISFGNRVWKTTKQTLSEDIMNSAGVDFNTAEGVALLSKYKAEIRAQFHKANMRIDRLKDLADEEFLISPAAVALSERGDISSIEHFSMDHDWSELIQEYGRAVAFLRQPTSSVTGTRVYCNHLKETFELSDDEYRLVSRHIMDKIESVQDEKFVNMYLLVYKDFTDDLMAEARSVADVIEEEAKDEAEELSDQIQSDIQRMLDTLGDFGI